MQPRRTAGEEFHARSPANARGQSHVCGITFAAMPRTGLPPTFNESRTPTATELDALRAISREALATLERCIETHHVAEVDYTDAHGHRSTIHLQPAFVRTNIAHHVVVWGIPIGEDHWEELRFDRFHAVRDSGEVFKPNW